MAAAETGQTALIANAARKIRMLADHLDRVRLRRIKYGHQTGAEYPQWAWLTPGDKLDLWGEWYDLLRALGCEGDFIPDCWRDWNVFLDHLERDVVYDIRAYPTEEERRILIATAAVLRPFYDEITEALVRLSTPENWTEDDGGHCGILAQEELLLGHVMPEIDELLAGFGDETAEAEEESEELCERQIGELDDLLLRLTGEKNFSHFFRISCDWNRTWFECQRSPSVAGQRRTSVQHRARDTPRPKRNDAHQPGRGRASRHADPKV